MTLLDLAWMAIGREAAEWNRLSVLASVFLGPWMALAGEKEVDVSAFNPYSALASGGSVGKKMKEVDMSWKEFVAVGQTKKEE